MKVAVTAHGQDLDAELDPRFGRCRYFLIIDLETGQLEALPNDAAPTPSGAGIRAAQLLSDKGVNAVVTGDVGPNAVRILQAAGIEVFTTDRPTVRAAFEQCFGGRQPGLGRQEEDAK